MQTPKGYKSNNLFNLFKDDLHGFLYSGEDYKLMEINYWLSRYLDYHSLIEVKFQNEKATNQDEKIISVLFEAFAQCETAPEISIRHFFENEQIPATTTERYMGFERQANYQKHQIPKKRYLSNMNYNSVLNKVDKITQKAEMNNGHPAYYIGTEFHRGNGCHSYALNILEALTDGKYPDPDFGFEISVPTLW